MEDILREIKESCARHMEERMKEAEQTVKRYETDPDAWQDTGEAFFKSKRATKELRDIENRVRYERALALEKACQQNPLLEDFLYKWTQKDDRRLALKRNASKHVHTRASDDAFATLTKASEPINLCDDNHFYPRVERRKDGYYLVLTPRYYFGYYSRKGIVMMRVTTRINPLTFRPKRDFDFDNMIPSGNFVRPESMPTTYLQPFDRERIIKVWCDTISQIGKLPNVLVPLIVQYILDDAVCEVLVHHHCYGRKNNV